MTTGNRTFTMVKPDAVAAGNTGNILAMIEQAGYKIVALKLTQLSEAKAGEFYAVHKERPFYGELVSFMSSGPIVAAILEKDNAVLDFRTLIGATDPSKAEEGTIRKKYAKNLGADYVGTYDQITSFVNEVTKDQGVDVVYDSVGKDYFDVCLASLKDNGMYVLCGAASGQVPLLDLGRLSSKSLAIRRPTLGAYTKTHTDRLSRLNNLVYLIQAGKLRYPPAKIFALDEVISAHDLIESSTYSNSGLSAMSGFSVSQMTS